MVWEGGMFIGISSHQKDSGGKKTHIVYIM